MRTTYVYRNGRMVNKDTGEPMVEGEWTPATPTTFSDLPGYQSPIDGKWIEGRRARRYDLEKNDCVDANEVGTLGGKFKNPRFAKKHNLRLTED